MQWCSHWGTRPARRRLQPTNTCCCRPVSGHCLSGHSKSLPSRGTQRWVPMCSAIGSMTSKRGIFVWKHLKQHGEHSSGASHEHDRHQRKGPRKPNRRRHGRRAGAYARGGSGRCDPPLYGGTGWLLGDLARLRSRVLCGPGAAHHLSCRSPSPRRPPRWTCPRTARRGASSWPGCKGDFEARRDQRAAPRRQAPPRQLDLFYGTPTPGNAVAAERSRITASASPGNCATATIGTPWPSICASSSTACPSPPSS